MEKLYAEFLLSYHEFTAAEKYESLLNEYFMQNPESKILLELEECSSVPFDALNRFMRYWKYECSIDENVFGKALFGALGTIYRSDETDFHRFADKCCSLWYDMLSELREKEPFLALCEAGDLAALEYDDLARKSFENALGFYG